MPRLSVLIPFRIRWQSILLGAIAVLLVTVISFLRFSVQSQITQQSQLVEGNSPFPSQDTAQIQRELLKLLISVQTTDLQTTDFVNFNSQINLVTSRFAALRNSSVDIHNEQTFAELDQQWLNLQPLLARWQEEPENELLQSNILEELERLELTTSDLTAKYNAANRQALKEITESTRQLLVLLGAVSWLFVVYILIVAWNTYRFIQERHVVEAELRRREQYLTALNDVTQTAVTVLDFHILLQTLAEKMAQLVSADECHITLWDEKKRQVIPAAAYGLRKDVFMSFQPPSGEPTLTEHVLTTGQLLVIENIHQSTLTSTHVKKMFPEEQATLALPLLTGGQKLGAILIIFRGIHHFSPEEIGQCEQAARQIALAVAKTQLITAERLAHQTAEVLRAANLELTKTLDLKTVSKTLLDFLAGLIPFDTANVMLLENDGTIGVYEIHGHEGWADPESVKQITFNLKTNLVFQELVKTKRGLLISDTSTYPGWEVPPPATYVRNWIGVPLIAGGNVIGFYSLNKGQPGFFTDDHLQLAETLAGSTAIAIQNAQLYQETRRWAEELQIVGDILHHLNATPSLVTAFAPVTASLKQLTQCDWTTIFLLGKSLGVGTLISLTEGGTASQIPTMLDFAESAAISDIAVGKPHFSPDLEAESRFARERELIEAGYRSKINLPLIVGEQVIGTFNLLWKRPNAYSLSQISVLTQVANAIALAVERSRLFERSNLWAQQMTELNHLGQQLSLQLERRSLCKAVTHTLHHSFNYLSVSVHSIDTQTQETVLEAISGPKEDIFASTGYRQKIGYGFIGKVAQTGDMLIIGDTSKNPDFVPSARMQVLSEAVFPLKVVGRTIGVLNVDSDQIDAFDENDINILVLVSDQLATALEKARLFEEIGRKTAELEAIAHLSQNLREANTINQMIPIILQKALAVVGGVLGSLFLIEPETGDIVARGAYPSDPSLLNRRFRPGQGITGYVAATGQIYTAEDLIKDPLAHFLPPETGLLSRIRSTISLPLRSQERIVGVLNINLPNIHKFTDDELYLLGAMCEIAGSAIERAILLDTLEQRVADRTRELEEANSRLLELDRLKSQFVSDVSHELRTPITNLSLYLDLLEQGKPEKQSHYLSVLRKQTNRLTDLISSILNLSRLDLGKSQVTFAPVKLDEITKQVLDAHLLKADEVGLTVTTEWLPDLPSVYGERNQLAQVITNLLSNAINYTPTGHITIQTGYDKTKEQVYLSVIDTGIGISENDKQHLFERFYRGEHASQSTIPGWGLGLAIVKEIVDLHHGAIEINSEPGVGSTFRVWLPVAK